MNINEGAVSNCVLFIPSYSFASNLRLTIFESVLPMTIANALTSHQSLYRSRAKRKASMAHVRNDLGASTATSARKRSTSPSNSRASE